MAQNITIAGATFNAVPSIVVPTSNNGSAIFVDPSPTTAIDSDVASGKIYFKADGTQSTGTASGGGGGASNLVQGSFTTSSTTNAASTFTIPYSGNGYPIALIIYIKNGMYNNGTGGNTTWYNSKQRYAIGQFSMVKARTNTAPTYDSTSDENNFGVIEAIYKNSTGSATTYSSGRNVNRPVYASSSTSATNGTTTAVLFKGNGKTVSYFVGYYTSSSDYAYGLMANTEYDYIAVYSS